MFYVRAGLNFCLTGSLLQFEFVFGKKKSDRKNFLKENLSQVLTDFCVMKYRVKMAKFFSSLKEYKCNTVILLFKFVSCYTLLYVTKRVNILAK